VKGRTRCKCWSLERSTLMGGCVWSGHKQLDVDIYKMAQYSTASYLSQINPRRVIKRDYGCRPTDFSKELWHRPQMRRRSSGWRQQEDKRAGRRFTTMYGCDDGLSGSAQWPVLYHLSPSIGVWLYLVYVVTHWLSQNA